MSEPTLLKQQVIFKFSEDVKLFDQIVEFYYNSRTEQLYLILPIIVYHGDYLEKKKLFQTTFSTPIDNLSDIIKYSEGFNFGIVNKFFTKHQLDIDFLPNLERMANNWISTAIPQPTPINGKSQIAADFYEFIEVDSETSFYGNFIQNGKEGCHLVYGKNGCKELMSLDYPTKVYNYHIPHSLRNGVDTYLMTKEQQFEFLKSLDLKDSLTILKNLWNENKSEEIDSGYYPFLIRLSGDDDDSWTKYFCTESDMMAEVHRLRRCQPINKPIDVEGNGYYFTN